MDLATQRTLIRFFESIHERVTAVDNFKSFGRIEVVCNPKKITYDTDLPMKEGIGVEFGCFDAAFACIQQEEQLGQPITFHVIDRPDQSAHFRASSWHRTSLPDKTDIDYEEALNHPLVLGWERFLDDYYRGVQVLKQHRKRLTAGYGNFVKLNIDSGTHLIDYWIRWMEMYTGHTPRSTRIELEQQKPGTTARLT